MSYKIKKVEKPHLKAIHKDHKIIFYTHKINKIIRNRKTSRIFFRCCRCLETGRIDLQKQNYLEV